MEALYSRHPQTSEEVLLLPVEEAGLDPGLAVARNLILQLGQKVANVVINILLVPRVSILL